MIHRSTPTALQTRAASARVFLVLITVVAITAFSGPAAGQSLFEDDVRVDDETAASLGPPAVSYGFDSAPPYIPPGYRVAWAQSGGGASWDCVDRVFDEKGVADLSQDTWGSLGRENADVALGSYPASGGLAAILAIEQAVNDVGLHHRPTATDINVSLPIGTLSSPSVAYGKDRIIVTMTGTYAPDDPTTPDDRILFGIWDTSGGGAPVQVAALQPVDELSSGVELTPSAAFISLILGGGAAQDAFVVVWESFGSTGDDNKFSSIQARYIGLDGILIGSQFQVNTSTTGFQRRPDAVGLEDGTYVVVWDSETSGGDDNSLTSIQGQRFGFDGLSLGNELQINHEILGFQYDPAVAAQTDGGFVVAWTDQPLSVPNIAARRFGPGAVSLGDQFQVNVSSPGGEFPDVAGGGGNFIVVWASAGGIYMNGAFGQIFSDGYESGDTTAWSNIVP